MDQNKGKVSEIDLNNLTPRLHNDCWVIADSRKWQHGCYLRKGSLVQGGAIFTEADSLKLADNLNRQVVKVIFGLAYNGTEIINGPFYAYRLVTAKQLGLL